MKIWPWDKDGVFVLEGEGEQKYLLTVRRAAEVLGIPQRTLRYAVRQGSVPARLERYPTRNQRIYFLEIDHLREACNYYGLPHVHVIDRLGDLLDWSDEQKALCALEWEGITKEDLEEFFRTGKFPWERVKERVASSANS